MNDQYPGCLDNIYLQLNSMRAYGLEITLVSFILAWENTLIYFKMRINSKEHWLPDGERVGIKHLQRYLSLKVSQPAHLQLSMKIENNFAVTDGLL